MTDSRRSWARFDIVVHVLSVGLGLYVLTVAIRTGHAWSYIAAAVLIGMPILRVYRVLRERAGHAQPNSADDQEHQVRHEGVFVQGGYVTSGHNNTDGPRAMDTGWVSISRLPFPTRDRQRKYRILIDGDLAGQIKPGQTLVVEVPTGTHTAQAKIDWTGSKILNVTIGSGATVELWTEPSGPAIAGLFQALSPQGYISLTDGSD